MSINSCDRCDRDLKDPNAKYGWRCEKLMGGGSIYIKTRSPTKAPVPDGGGQSYGEVAVNPSPGEYLSRTEKYTTFAKEFVFEAAWITSRNLGGSIWHLPEYIEQANGILSMLKALFTGAITPADVVAGMMDNVAEGIGGDLHFVLTHLEWYAPNTELTKAETAELAKRTARAWEEGTQLAMILYGAVKYAMARNAGAAMAAEGKGNAIVDSRKFSDYIFKDGAAPGKDAIFKKLGYSEADSALLTEIFQEQGATKYASGRYTLGKLDGFGQRINIEIELHGIGNAVGKASYINSGWMIKPDGTISLNTPFAGFTK